MAKSKHHQGGLAGYEPREALALPTSNEILLAGNAVAVNPTIAGTKSEDAAILEAYGARVITEMRDWPVAEIELQTGTIV
ncbi:MAG: hypothetical protein IPK60_10225 [Sandaracinaceae bacterium]|nr:hypothetical protein [Sandaracinaceae bacterium]